MKTLLCSISLMLAVAFSIGTAQAQTRNVTLSWFANPSNPAGTRYNVYRATAPAPGGCTTALTFSKMNNAPINALSMIDATVPLGTTLCYRATATNGTDESSPSGIAEAVIPGALMPPSTPVPTVSGQQALNEAPVVNGSIKLAEAKYIDVWPQDHATWEAGQANSKPVVPAANARPRGQATVVAKVE